MTRGSFVELDKFVTHRCTDFGMQDQKVLGDGVITGYGMASGRQVFCSRKTSPCLADRCPVLTRKNLQGHGPGDAGRSASGRAQ